MSLEVVERFSRGPSTLREIGCLKVGELAAVTLSKRQLPESLYVPGNVEQDLRCWVSSLPAQLRQDIMDKAPAIIFNTVGKVTQISSSLIPLLLSSMAEVLYTGGLRSIRLWMDLSWHREARMRVLHLLHSEQSSIQRLDLSCYHTPLYQYQELHFSEKFLLTNILNKLGNLRSLVIPYVADDEMLAKLGAGMCPGLEELDIQGSWGVTSQGAASLAGQDGGVVIGRVGWTPSHFTQCSEGMKLLSEMLKGSPVSPSDVANLIAKHKKETGLLSSLHLLDVRGTSIDSRGLECLLENFRQLVKLSADEQLWQGLLGTLGRSGTCDECFGQNLPLRVVSLGRNTYNMLEPLSKVFPNLERITLNNYERSEIYLDGTDNLKHLHKFARLNSMILNDVEMAPVCKFFENGGLGSQITSLVYESNNRQIDLALLDKLCPNLRELSITNTVVQFKFPPNQAKHRCFSRLKELTFKDVAFSEEHLWKKMLKRTFGLEKISLHNIRLTDADISDVLAANPMLHLQEINISANTNINLSENSAYKLIERCPRLCRIGGICCWSPSNMVILLDTLFKTYSFKIRMGDWGAD